jgi:membrane protease YdiL (CAAX protease family)
MDYRKANRAYLYMILSTLAFVVIISAWIFRTGGDLPVIFNNLLSELMILIPGVAMVLYHGDRLRVLVPLKKIKAPSILLTILYVLMLFPLVTFVNSLSMLFVENTVVGISDQITMLPMWQMLLSIGLLGPLAEEVVFRGIILQSYQRTGRIIGSIVLSSIMFGMMHMNFNQFAYGAVMGIMLSLLVEATGSVLSSFIAHATFNSIEVVLLYFTSDTLDDAEEILENFSGSTELLTIGIYFVGAVIFTALAICVAYKISKIESRNEFFINIPKCLKQGYKLITVPLVIAFIIATAYMILVEVVNSLL